MVDQRVRQLAKDHLKLSYLVLFLIRITIEPLDQLPANHVEVHHAVP
jgi:hypothetical protein